MDVRELVHTIARRASKAGFKSFIGRSGTYGFYGIPGEHTVYFETRYGGVEVCFNGCYRAVKPEDARVVGMGWQVKTLGPSEAAAFDPARMYEAAARAPHWATEGRPVRLLTPEAKYEAYNPACGYEAVEDGAQEGWAFH